MAELACLHYACAPVYVLRPQQLALQALFLREADSLSVEHVVTALELRLIAERLPGLNGWDFSPMRIDEDPPPWRYEDVVCQYLPPGGRVLDIGTGGGELLSSFASHIASGMGIDISRDRIETAVRDALNRRASNMQFLLMDGSWLAFAPSSLDAVLAHHADFLCEEVLRVLRRGGVFVSQQIGDRNNQNIFDAFRWGSFGAFWRDDYSHRGAIYRTSAEKADIFRTLGAEIVDLAEYDLDNYFVELASLVFFLKESPLPDAFNPERYWRPISELIDQHSTPRGIRTNAHRELLVIRKP